MMDLCYEHRGSNLDWHPIDGEVSGADARVLMSATLPLAEIVTGFFDKLKSRSSGFASFECVSALLLHLLFCVSCIFVHIYLLPPFLPL